MGEIEDKDETTANRYFMGMFAFLLYPALLFVLGFYAFPATDGWLRAGVIALMLFFISADIFFITWLLPRKSVECFRGVDGLIRIPMRKLPAIYGLIVGGIILVLAPIGAPLIFAVFVITIVTDPQEIAPVLTDWNLYNLYETVDRIVSLPAFLCLLVFTPLFLPSLLRMLKRQWKIIHLDETLLIDHHGLTLYVPEKVHLPWAAISDARVWNTAGVMLNGDSRVDALRAHFHRRWPKAYIPEGFDSGTLLTLDLYPVSARSVAELIRKNIGR